MQRRRTVRKIIQEPQAIVHRTNIQRRNENNEPIRTTNNQAIAVNVSRNLQLRNSALDVKDLIIKYATVPKLFQGETIYIIGGGPSLKNFNFQQLQGCKTIAINKAIIYHNTADILYWTDGRFYTWFKNEVDSYRGLKFALKPGSQYTHDIQVLKKGKPYGLEEDPQSLAHGFNSGYAAINLAYHLGAARIILLGFDMANDGKITHFHDGYPTKGAGDHIYKEKFLPGFDQLNSEIRAKGVHVFNATSYSRLNSFPKITIEQALSFR
jgi:hypothetical protein|tara:strand:+ start:395 stop:1195 length:801 start_codon:yes stop_codon:yes gene_type:complete